MTPSPPEAALLPGPSALSAPDARHPPVQRRAGLRVRPDMFRWFLFILTLITISRIHQHFHFIALLRPALLMTGLAAAYAWMKPSLLAPEGLLRTLPARVILAFGVLACLSVPFGLSVGNSGLFIITDYSKTLIFAMLVVVSIRGVQDLWAYVWAFVISTGILVWMSLFVFGLSKAGSQAERLSNLYTYDANDVGLMVLVGLGLTLLAFQLSRGLPRLFCLVVLFGIGATLSRTGSRGAFLGALVVGLSLLLLLKGVSPIKRIGFVAVAAAALFLYAPAGYWDQMETIKDPQADYNWTEYSGRKRVSQRAIGYMMSNPLTGIGIANFGKAECTISPRAVNPLRRGPLKCSAAHNSYLEAGAELGIPGLLLWVGAVFGSIFAMIRLRGRIPREWMRGDREARFLAQAPTYFALSMIAFAVCSFFVSFAWMDPIYFLLALMAGLQVSLERKAKELGVAFGRPARPPSRRSGPRS
ncbi:MAG TPA: O-antigen ligase family protein [Gemmatimonadales bacterium]|nr:O-antigen ligase family protein [Gemmatimonadales bacterium]